MEQHGLRQHALAKKAGVSQRTISNLLNPDAAGNSMLLVNVDKVAAAFNLPGWRLMIPGQDEDLLSSASMDRLVTNYMEADKKGREYIEHVAAKEALYRAVGTDEQRTAGSEESSATRGDSNK